MGFVANRANLAHSNVSGATDTFTTSGAVASGNKIILRISSDAPVSSISGGGLTWVIDKAALNQGNITVAHADCPSGLASGTTITVTYSGGLVVREAYRLDEYTGLTTGSPVAGQMASATGGTQNPDSGLTANAASSSDAVIGAICWRGATTLGAWTAGSGYSIDSVLSNSNNSMVSESKTGAGSTVRADATTTDLAAQWAAIVVIYGANVTLVSTTDSASGSDASTERAVLPRTDSASGTDASTERAALPRTDTGTGTNASVVSTVGDKQASDSATANDSSVTRAVLAASDSATGVQQVKALKKPIADSAHASDAGAVRIRFSVSDSASASDHSTRVRDEPIVVRDGARGHDSTTLRIHDYVDEGTVIGEAVISGTQAATLIDAGVVIGAGHASALEEYVAATGQVFNDTGLVIGAGQPSATESTE